MLTISQKKFTAESHADASILFHFIQYDGIWTFYLFFASSKKEST